MLEGVLRVCAARLALLAAVPQGGKEGVRRTSTRVDLSATRATGHLECKARLWMPRGAIVRSVGGLLPDLDLGHLLGELEVD